MESNDLDEIGQQLEIDARSWIEQEKPLERLYEGERFDLAKEWVRQHAVSVEAWEFFEACMINSLRHFAIGWSVACASTEIRTPLTSIQGYITLLLEEHYGPIKLTPDQFRCLEIIKANAERLSGMFSDAQEEARQFDGKHNPDQ